jgi:hypothetical protein
LHPTAPALTLCSPVLAQAYDVGHAQQDIAAQAEMYASSDQFGEPNCPDAPINQADDGRRFRII